MSEYSTYEPRVPVRASRRRIRDVDYYVSEWGDDDAPLIVFLHGWGDTGSTFQFVVDEMAGEWHVVAPDWRGFGRSHSRADSYWFPDYLADLDLLLAHYSPDDPVKLVGHSMGANVAGLYAGTLPERVAAFVNIEGFGLADSNPEDAPDRYRDWILQGHQQPKFSQFEDFNSLAQHTKRRSPNMSDERAQFVAREWAKLEQGRLELRADPAHKLPNAVLYRRTEAEACWRRTTAPVLLVAGRDSYVLEAFAEHFDGQTLDLPFPLRQTQVIDDCGHMVHFEAPERLAAAAEAFLSDNL